MRTLKKTLSLVLVVAMVLGLCVVGASAYNKVEEFTDDVDKIGDAYYEAVGVLTGIQVIDGMTETSFQPQGNYTREQAAKIIAYMMLGKADADSLRCTKAPFDDVAADRWSAGYIAFCVEQGIIDGMTETTFEPTGTLTGFQWAKMLLCAVGFGVKGEFTGSSWSLNTSKYAHNVDLFAGDLAGADHTAITREQAALYAFNVLTAVDLVVYSESLGDYIKGYNSWFVDRYTPQGTLAETVFKLYNTTGVVVNNEAMGNATTDIAASYTTAAIAKVKAGTGLDMMYHGVKVWFTGTAATKTAAASGTAVFVKDLAKVTEYCCYDIAAGMLAADKLSPKAELDIGTGTAYEFDVIDNSAVGQGTATVTTYAYLAKLGYASTVNKTTFIGSENVKNDYIKTDISGITSTVTPNVVIKASTTAYHVYAPTATSGAVTKVTKEANGSYTVTLSDGTALKQSKLEYGNVSTTLHELAQLLVEDRHVSPNYYFLLDTHGHYMFLSQDPFRSVAYFTGVTKLSSAHDAWSNAVQYQAQFVDIKTGEIKVVPVSNQWVADNFKGLISSVNWNEGNWFGVIQIIDILGQGRYGQWYFDITDELYGDANYYPEAVFDTDNGEFYYGANSEYAFVGWAEVGKNIAGSKQKVSVDGVGYRYDYDNTVFYIANNAGDKLTVDKYVGVDALLAGYAEKHNSYISTIYFHNAAITLKDSAAGNKEVATLFAFDETEASGEFAFFPTDVTWTSVADDYVAVTGYLNGTKTTEIFKFEKDYFINGLGGKIARGFYGYSFDEDGYAYNLHRVPIQEVGLDKSKVNFETVGSKTYLNDVLVESDCVVVDTRKGAGVNFDAINDLNTLVSLNRWTNTQYGSFTIAYTTWPSFEPYGSISTIYVVENNLSLANVGFAQSMEGWSVKAPGAAYEDEYVYLRNDEALEGIAVGTDILVGGTYRLSTRVDGDGAPVFDGAQVTFKEVPATVVEYNGVKYVYVKVTAITGTAFGSADVTIGSLEYEVEITNKADDFAVYYKYPSDGGVDKNVALVDNTGKVTIAVGSDIKLCFERTNVANNTVATVDLTGAADQTVSFGSNQAWTNAFVPVTNELVIESVTAVYDFVLDEATAVDYFGLLSVDGYNKVEDVVLVPGDTIDLVIKYSQTSDLLKTAGLNFPNFTLGTGTKYASTQAASTVAESGQPLNFVYEDVLPGAVAPQTDGTNVVTVTFAGWFSDTGVEWTGN